MVTVLQILFVLTLIVLIIRLVFQSRRPEPVILPENTEELLGDYVVFYAGLGEEGRTVFLDKMKRFLSAVKITGANAEVEDLDRILIGAAAIMPVFYIPDWEYINLREILLYPGNFNTDYEQQGNERLISGMVGTGNLENIMILSKWELRQGFINRKNNRNMALHEFIHLIDKMDGTLDGVPEILLQRKFVPQWLQLLEQEMESIRRGQSDIDSYAATSPVECFAVVAEYFFEQPALFSEQHPALHELLQQIFIRK